MSRTVWKFILDVRQPASWVINAELSARIVAVRAVSPSDMDVWIELDPSAEARTLKLLVIGTGHPVPTHHDHVGTAFCDPFIWHVYQERWDAPQ